MVLVSGCSQWTNQVNGYTIEAGSNLADANLSYADLTGANLSYADLTGANLREADLGGTTMSDGTIHP